MVHTDDDDEEIEQDKYVYEVWVKLKHTSLRSLDFPETYNSREEALQSKDQYDRCLKDRADFAYYEIREVIDC